MKNFTNGALVFRLWTFDGSGEIIAKFQYFNHATGFAALKLTLHGEPDENFQQFNAAEIVIFTDDEALTERLVAAINGAATKAEAEQPEAA